MISTYEKPRPLGRTILKCVILSRSLQTYLRYIGSHANRWAKLLSMTIDDDERTARLRFSWNQPRSQATLLSLKTWSPTASCLKLSQVPSRTVAKVRAMLNDYTSPEYSAVGNDLAGCIILALFINDVVCPTRVLPSMSQELEMSAHGFN